MKSHPIVLVLGMALILSTLVSLVSWGGSPTTPRASASNLQTPHPLDVGVHRSRQTAVGHTLPQQYVEHEPIHITNNADFAAFGFPGEGSPSNPYVIENLNITRSNETLIRIKDTTAYFCIRNNHLNGLTDWEPHGYLMNIQEAYGIKLKHVTNGLIDSNLVINCEIGILLNQSEQNTLTHNIVSHNYYYGIFLEHSKYSTIANNTVANNHFKAIELANSGNSTLTHNIVTNNDQGIRLLDSGNSTIANNTVSHNSFSGISSSYEQNTVAYNTVSNCGFGIKLGGLKSTVANNTVTNCSYGISLFSSEQNTVTYNTVSQNKYAGIWLSESGNNTVAHNTVSQNRDAGILLHVSGNNTLFENCLLNNDLVFDFYQYGKRGSRRLMPVQHHIQATVAENVVNGRPLVYWQNVRGGTVPLGAGQVVLMNTTGVEVTGQDLTRVNIGVFAAFSSHLDIHHNTLSNNSLFGIALESSNHSTIAHNTVSNGRFGISLEHSEHSTVTHNSASNCGDGIWLKYSKHSTVANNTVANCGTGIYLSRFSNSTLAHNTVANSGRGIALWSSENSTLIHNTVSNCGEAGGDYRKAAIVFAHSENITVVHNTVFQSNGYGITLSYFRYSILAHNIVFQSNDHGIIIRHSVYNTLTNNTLSQNRGYGIDLDSKSVDNVVMWNDFLGNHPGEFSQASDEGSNNVFARNYWDDHDTTDRNGDGIADYPYIIYGAAVNQDLTPLMVYATPHSLSTPTIAYPYGDETLQGTATIQWVAAIDTWEHSVTYTVSYSADDGYTWILLASGLSTSEYEWDTTTVADGAAYRIQVVATCSDGLTAEDHSDVPFTIQNPEATTTTSTTETSTSLPPVGAFPAPAMPNAMLFMTLLLLLVMHEGRRGKRQAR